MRLAIDVGGTFVDFVKFDDQTGTVTIEKVPSSGQLAERFMEGVDKFGLELRDVETIVHGSTLVINTIVQETGAKVGLITTAGFRDVLELGRGNRPEIYNLFYKQPTPLVPRYLRFEVPERLDHSGGVLTPLDEAAARAAVETLIKEEVDAIAVCFLHAFTNPAHEQRMKAIIQELFPHGTVSISSDIVREWREFERTSTTVINAYTQPQVDRYLSDLEARLSEEEFDGQFNVMQSSGGVIDAMAAKAAPVRMIQSGPAGGVIGATGLGAALGTRNLLSADVGGTTFDVALIVDGTPLEKSSEMINRRPILQPTLDIVSIGAGGGSIAWIDPEGGLRIGPHSAQADPGPICFGLGGTEPTVTDAQVVLGYLDPHYYLGQRMTLDKAAAAAALDEKIARPLGLSIIEAADGIIRLTNMNMALAMRQMTIERGYDPRDFSFVCFGGGGGLFISALLAELEMKEGIVPLNPAIFSAWGLLNADFREDFNQTTVFALEGLSGGALAKRFQGLLESEQLTVNSKQLTVIGNRLVVDDSTNQLSNKPTLQLFCDCRYIGQEHTVTVPVLEQDLTAPDLSTLKSRFDAAHQHAYAHALPHHPAEVVNLRLRQVGLTPKPQLTPLPQSEEPVGHAQKGEREVYFRSGPAVCPVYDRSQLGPGHSFPGPAIVEEWTSTILIRPGQMATVDAYGNIVIK